MEPAEVEFLAEKELVTITPNFSENKICLISVSCLSSYWRTIYCTAFLPQGDFGPFNPSMHTKVPLWLAVNLRQRQKCRIEPPEWLSIGAYVLPLNVSLSSRLPLLEYTQAMVNIMVVTVSDENWYTSSLSLGVLSVSSTKHAVSTGCNGKLDGECVAHTVYTSWQDWALVGLITFL